MIDNNSGLYTDIDNIYICGTRVSSLHRAVGLYLFLLSWPHCDKGIFFKKKSVTFYIDNQSSIAIIYNIIYSMVVTVFFNKTAINYSNCNSKYIIVFIVNNFTHRLIEEMIEYYRLA